MLSLAEIQSAIPQTLLGVDLPGLGPRTQGKVRDIFVGGGQRILITTDCVSAFDRVLGGIPSFGGTNRMALASPQMRLALGLPMC